MLLISICCQKQVILTRQETVTIYYKLNKVLEGKTNGRLQEVTVTIV